MTPHAIRDFANWMRFDYQRSWRRASPPQVRRLVRNLIERPPSRHARRLVSIGLTHRCQNRCDWCATGAYSKDPKGELSTSEVEKLLSQIEASRFVFNNVSFLGGECLLRDDIFHLVRHAASLGLFVHLSTNGLKLDQACVTRLAQAGLNSVFVAWSTDTAQDVRRDKQRETVLQAVRECVRQDLPCFLSVCACPQDLKSGSLQRVIELGRQLGVAGVRLMPVRLSGRWLWQPVDKVLDAREEGKVRELCRSGFAFLTDDASRQAGRRCQAVAGRILYVSPYGEVQPCHFFPFSFGGVRQSTLDTVLQRMWSHDLMQGEGDRCLLHDETFRSKHILPLSPGVQLPVAL